MEVTHYADKDEGFTAKMWVRQAVRLLNDKGFIHCPDVMALENEVSVYAITNDAPTVLGEPFRIHTSQFSS